jgi:hypothetical protein
MEEVTRKPPFAQVAGTALVVLSHLVGVPERARARPSRDIAGAAGA